MELTVNQKAVDAPPEDGLTLDAVLNHLREAGRIPEDQLIVGISVDRQSLSASEMQARREEPLGPDAAVAVATEGVQGYGRRILADAAGMVDVLNEAVPRVAEALRTKGQKEANEELFFLLDAVQRLLVCLNQVQNTCELAQGPGGDRLAAVSGALTTMQAAQEQEDWPALADALEAELAPAVEGLVGLVQDMRSEF
ncbi:MAG: hypothetical protein R6V05_14525 [Candidatus Brocadiia bacterium]